MVCNHSGERIFKYLRPPYLPEVDDVSGAAIVDVVVLKDVTVASKENTVSLFWDLDQLVVQSDAVYLVGSLK